MMRSKLSDINAGDKLVRVGISTGYTTKGKEYEVVGKNPSGSAVVIGDDGDEFTIGSTFINRWEHIPAQKEEPRTALRETSTFWGDRMDEIVHAMELQIAVGKPIPSKWNDERNEILKLMEALK